MIPDPNPLGINNPTLSSKLTVTDYGFSIDGATVNLKLYSVMAGEIMQIKGNGINTSSLAKGVYFIAGTVDGEVVKYQFAK